MQPRITDVVIFEELGRGHGSAVFRGVFRGNACTIKFPNTYPHSSTIANHAFEQDMLQLARLRDVGLPRVLSLDASAGTAYALLELQDGVSLIELFAATMPETVALDVALRLTQCIAALHAAGFVHGDLSAAHLLWSGATQTLSLLDSGSVHRPLPFEPALDLHALHTVLRQLASRITLGEAQRNGLTQIVKGWSNGSNGTRGQLSQLIHELEQRRLALAGASIASTASTAVVPAAHSISQSKARRTPPSLPRGHVRSELALLRRRWEATQDQDGKVLVVIGAAGSGKSRLLRSFREHVSSHDMLVLAIKCADGDWAPFSAIKRLLDQHLRDVARLDGKLRSQLETALRSAAGPMASHLRLLSPRLAHVFRDAQPVQREGDAQQLFVDGLAEFLAKYLESAQRSTLIIDDVHWLDASSRMVLSRLAARICPQGHMVLCGARDDEDLRETIDRFAAVLPAGLLEKVMLGPLTDDDARDVVAEFLGVDEVSQEAIVEPLSRLSDGTPLSLLELLDLAFERRLLRPRNGVWQLDWTPLQQMRLPASSRALIERRLSMLEPNTVKVLCTAAIIRSRIDPQVLAAASAPAITAEQAQVGLDRASRARLLVQGADDAYEFVHDSVWESLLRLIQPAEQRALHQRVAEALWNAPRSRMSFDHDYELARHLAGGDVTTKPRRTYQALRHAGKRASQACDDMLALSFLKPAEQAAGVANITLPRDFYVDLAEASLRTGATSDSLTYFELALRRSRPGVEAAHVRGRMAWLHHYESHTVACWAMLEAALLEYDRDLPADSPASALWAMLDHVPANLTLPKILRRAPALAQTDLETLCELYWLCARVAVESGLPMRGLAAIVHLAAAAKALQPCRVLVQAELVTAFALATISPRTPWRSHLTRAQSLSRQLADPIAQTFCHQFQYVIMGWLGDQEESRQHALICVDERAHYMELGELCHLCFAMYATEIVLGHPEAALAWLERAITRAQQTPRAPAIFVLIEEAAHTTLLTLGREHEIPELTRRIARIQRSEIRSGSYFHYLSYQTRVQRLIDDGELGQPFETLLREWQSLRQNPRQAHLVVAIYYVHVAHARVHQCLHAQPMDLPGLLIKLELALADVEAAAREPVITAHGLVTRAALYWLRNDADSATACEQALTRAEHLARETSCAWVSFAASRLRAHMLKARQKHGAARDQARAAAQIARQYGSKQRLRAICEEFELAEFLVEGKAGDADTPSVRRHLDALLHIAQASSRDLGPSRQARFIVDELLETLSAERGFLFMRDALSSSLHCHAACHTGGQDLLAAHVGYDKSLVDQVYGTGQTLLAGGDDLRLDPAGPHERACIVVALVLREQVVGVLYLDRHAAAGSFSSEDVALIEALANQVPVALELAGALRERERLEQNLRQAQKMEAIGRLAGGIAHDFNNILATIEFAAGCLTGHVSTEGEEDLAEIRDASRRGADLTRQLLMFSRGKSIPPRRIDLVEVLQRGGPMLSRMVRSDVTVNIDLPDEALLTMADPSQIERLLMNLCRNASDAMPHGGSIGVRLAPATDVPEHLVSPRRGNEDNGQDTAKATHAELTVSDTGTGMSEEVRSRLFEPFFTTKPSQQGTGLGLAIVYTIVKQYGGHIEVLSELGAGATFRIHLPLCHELPVMERLPPLPAPRESVIGGHLHDGRVTLLVVDDDDVLRKQSARTLEAAGFDILTATDGEDALRVVASARDLPELAITDMQMPGMDGAQLAKRLLATRPDMKLVFVSGDSPDALISSGALNDNAVFLQKPFKPEALLREIETLLLDMPRQTRHSGVFKLGSIAPDGDADEAEQPR